MGNVIRLLGPTETWASWSAAWPGLELTLETSGHQEFGAVGNPEAAGQSMLVVGECGDRSGLKRSHQTADLLPQSW